MAPKSVDLVCYPELFWLLGRRAVSAPMKRRFRIEKS